MAWIELHQAVWTHRKTFELAALLGVDETYAAAHVIRLWTWALDNAPDGDLSSLSARAIAYGAGWHHEVDLFVRALTSAGWLDEDKAIHDWMDYAGKLVVRRKEDAERKRLSRGAAPDVRGTSNGTAAGIRRTGPDPTGPDPTGPEKTAPTPQPPAPQAGQGADSTPEGATTSRNSRRRRVAGGESLRDPASSEVTVSQPTEADVALWAAARGAFDEFALTKANAEAIASLEPAGRAADGGLRLRAPPSYGDLTRFTALVRKVLADAGDAAATHAAVLRQAEDGGVRPRAWEGT